MFDLKKLKKYNGRKAVSPVVATLILIIVAIVGAVAVGLIVSGIGNQTAKNANGGSAASNSQTQLFVGGSTTLYPLELAANPNFQATSGLAVTLSQGGSDAGMQGVLSGALDIGTASSANAVNNLENAVISQSLAGVTVHATLIGGSGVVVGTTSTANGAVGPALQLPLTDGTTPCLVITRAALAQMYVDGQFRIAANACSGAAPLLSVLDIAGVNPTTGTGTGPYQTVSRSDVGGTEDAFGSYINGQGVPALSYTSGSGILGASSNTGAGNLGVLQVTQKCAFTGTAGCVGFFDLGFAEGASSAAAATCAGTGTTPCGVAIPELVSVTPTGAFAPTVASSAAVNQYINAGQTTTGLHAFIKTALKAEGTVDPLTLSGAKSVYPDTSAPVNSLCRTFYLVTNGSPTTNEQRYITFMSSFNAEPFYTAQGYFSQYDFTAA